MIIKGIGHFTPDNKLTNQDLEKLIDTSDEWIVTRTGIRERSIAPKGMETSDMAARSSENALKAAGMDIADIDLIVVATCSSDMTMPAAANLLQDKLGAREVPSFDINAACSGFVYGMEVCDGLINNPNYKNILLACSEKLTKFINYKDRGTCILFGDGSGSVILSREGQGPKLVSSYAGSNGKLSGLLVRPAGGSAIPPHETTPDDDNLFVKMEGKEVFKYAVRGMSEAAHHTLERAGWKAEEVDWLVPHQANARLIASAREKLGLPEEKVFLNLDKYGNMSAASIPVAMSEALPNFQPGQKILCLAFGAGLTWGGLAIEWN